MTPIPRRKLVQNDCAECCSVSGHCFPSVTVLLLSHINLSGSGLHIITYPTWMICKCFDVGHGCWRECKQDVHQSLVFFSSFFSILQFFDMPNQDFVIFFKSFILPHVIGISLWVVSLFCSLQLSHSHCNTLCLS